ncbi:MAG: VOC family protein [Chloroflexi bacterium]|nr:VOC family protein [Chloroflexota bacterium]
MPRVVHFEIPVDDPERAIRFYEKALGWQISKWEGPIEYWMVKTGEEAEPGIDGGIMRRMGNTVTQNTVDVPSVDEFTQKVVEAGGSVVAPKMVIPGVGYMAYYTDTEGNVFGAMQEDPSAK